MDDQAREIIETVAQGNSTYFIGSRGEIVCPYCAAFQTQDEWLFAPKEFVHDPECIITKARELLKQLTKGK